MKDWRDNEKYGELQRWRNLGARRAAIQTAFLINPSLGNHCGRMALQLMCQLLWEAIPPPYDDCILVTNLGGSSPHWIGNCKIATMDNEDIARMTDKRLVSYIKEKSFDDDDGKCISSIRVPDFQVSEIAGTLTGKMAKKDRFTAVRGINRRSTG